MSTTPGQLRFSTRLPQQQSAAGQISEKCIRSGIAIGGLLILRAIASALPMLKYADPLWHRSLTDLSGANNLPQSMASLGAVVQNIMQAAAGAQLQRGWLAAINAQSGSQAADSVQKGLIAMHLAIFPITVVRVTIDTVILVLLLRLGYEVGAVVRENFRRLPSLGQILSLLTAILVVSLAYGVYQGIFYPLLGPQNVNLYGWIFLGIGVIPLIGIVLNVSQNMDAITGAVFRSAQAMAGALKCSGCGRPLAPRAKFCPYCGTVAEVSAPMPATQRKYCASCGTENPPESRFCKDCGQTIPG